MVLTDKFYKRILLLCASGVLTGLTVTFPTIWIFGWLTLVPLAVFLLSVVTNKSVKLHALYGYGFAFFMSFGVVNFHWFINLYPLDFIDGMTRGGAMAVVLLGTFGLSTLQAVQGALLFPLAALLFRSKLIQKLSFLQPIIIASLWAVYEWTQTLGWWGVPWGRLAISQTALPVGIQTASLFGSYFISFLIVLVNSYIAYGLVWALMRTSEERRSAIRLSAIVCCSVLIFQYGAGLCIWLLNTPEKDGKTVSAAAIQGNIPSGEKWDTETTSKTFEVYEKYTAEAAKSGAEIVVFPETALPWVVREGNRPYTYLSRLSKTYGVTILAGVLTEDADGDYNSILCFTPDGKASDTVYNKRHLVPFGEYVPMKDLITLLAPPLAELVLSSGEISEGEGANIFELEEANIGSIICFDSIFEVLTLDSVREGASLICISTNDSWFTDSAALHMHNAQAKLRAVECDRYVVRAANTGISSIITNRGESVEELPPLESGYIVQDVEIRTGRTLYSYIGNSFVYLCIAFLTVILSINLCNLFKKMNKYKTFLFFLQYY